MKSSVAEEAVNSLPVTRNLEKNSQSDLEVS